MNDLDKQRIHSDLSGQGVAYAIALLVLIAYLLIASGIMQPSSSAPPPGAAPQPQPPYGVPHAD
ncbi:hypothetical protein ACFL6X_02210 [Candidatus Latescibacterota bacterium]